jgi:alanine dehydrogenase
VDGTPERLTLGLPRIRNEEAELRDFHPELVHVAVAANAEVLVERGYGSALGYLDSDYLIDPARVRVVDRAEALAADIVLMLRPSEDVYEGLRAGSTFIAMLHFPTHKERAQRLKELGIDAIALDLIVDDEGERLVENMQAVAWNGLDVGFNVLERQLGGLRNRDVSIRVLILGAGLVGKHAVEAATKFGNLPRAEALVCDCEKPPGVEVITAGRNLTGNDEYMKQRLRRVDMLVDAARRSDPSRPLVPNRWLRLLPPHAVIVDLAVDPYLLDENPPVVRGIEGIPAGDLNQYVFGPRDPAWDQLPAAVPNEERRWTASCYSWPGIDPGSCMRHYGRQLEPLLQTLLTRRSARFLRLDGPYLERALQRGTLAAWLPYI